MGCGGPPPIPVKSGAPNPSAMALIPAKSASMNAPRPGRRRPLDIREESRSLTDEERAMVLWLGAVDGCNMSMFGSSQ